MGTSSNEPVKARGVSLAWLQTIDYATGALLGFVAFHVHGAMLGALAAGAGALLLLGLMTAGPLGIYRHIGRRGHRRVTLLISLGLACSPLLVRHHLDPLGVLGAELAAVVLVRLAYPSFLLWRRRPGVATGTPTVELPVRSVEPSSSPTAIDIAARSAGRVSSQLGGVAADVAPHAAKATLAAVRGLGRIVGGARRGGAR